jgi:hypothetical protein
MKNNYLLFILVLLFSMPDTRLLELQHRVVLANFLIIFKQIKKMF